MKFFLSLGLILLFGYELIVHFVHTFYEISPTDAKHRVNQKIVSLLNSSANEQPIVNIFFSNAEWQDLGHTLSRHFYSISLYSVRDNGNGTLSVRYALGGINTKYKNDLGIINQIITIDTCNWIYNMLGCEIPIHIQSISNVGLHLVFAYNQKGVQVIQKLASIRLQNTSSVTQKKCCSTYDFKRNSNNKILVLGIDYDLWHEYSIRKSLSIDLGKVPHLLVIGSTGTGKSYALNFYIQQILAKNTLYDLCFTDFKNSKDFHYLASTNGVRYASGDSVVDAIFEYYDMFWNAKEGIQCPSLSQILIIDEYPALITHLSLTDKKKAEKVKSIIADILMLGRDINGLSFLVFITCQRPDAILFQNGVRENFGTIVAFGNLSSESRGMISAMPNELPDSLFQLGEGIVKTINEPTRSIIVPKITNLHSACAVFPPESTPHP